MGTTNFGNQKLSFDYNEAATSRLFNTINHKLVPTGIYEGFNLSKVNDTLVRLNVDSVSGKGLCFIQDSGANISVRVEVSDNIDISVSSANSKVYIVLRMVWVDAVNNFMDVLAVEFSDNPFESDSNKILPSDLVVGRIIYDGSTLRTTFDLTRRNNFYLKDVRDKTPYLCVKSSEPNSNVVKITSGQLKAPSGLLTINSADIIIPNTTTNGRNDIIWVDTSGVIQITQGVEGVSPITPTYGDKKVIAEIRRPGSGAKTIVTGDQIIKIIDDYNMSPGAQDFLLGTMGNTEYSNLSVKSAIDRITDVNNATFDGTKTFNNLISFLEGIDVKGKAGLDIASFKNSAGVKKVWIDQNGYFNIDNNQLVTNLNADILDGQHGSYYQNSSNQNAGTLPVARLPALAGDVTSSVGSNSLALVAASVLAKLLTVDGAGSGLDADLLDGQHAGQMLSQNGYGQSADMGYELGLAQDIAVNSDFAYKYRFFVSGNQNGQNLFLQRLRRGFGWETIGVLGTTTAGVDADLLDGQHGSFYLPVGSYTAADVLAKLLNVDGAGSLLDADLLDGQHGSFYLPVGSYTAADVLAKLLNVDGAGSLLDADLLDGQHGSFYQNAGNLNAGLIPLARIPTDLTGKNVDTVDGQHAGQMLSLNGYGQSADMGYELGLAQDIAVNTDFAYKWRLWVSGNQTGQNLYLQRIRRGHNWETVAVLGTTTAGVDADLLDGQQGSFYQNADNLNAGTVPQARLSAASILALLLTVDSAGSLLDADLLDGQHGSFYQNAGNLNAGTIPLARIPTDLTGKNASQNVKSTSYDASANLGFEIGSSNFDSVNDGSVLRWRLYVKGNAAGQAIWLQQLRRSGGGLGSWTDVCQISGGDGSGLDADLLDGKQSDAAATANTIPIRDASGRMKAATPSASDDVATRGYVDGLRVGTNSLNTFSHNTVNGAKNSGELFTALSSRIPNTGDTVPLSGGIISSGVLYPALMAVRDNATTITVYAVLSTGVRLSAWTGTSGSSAALSTSNYGTIAWL